MSCVGYEATAANLFVDDGDDDGGDHWYPMGIVGQGGGKGGLPPPRQAQNLLPSPFRRKNLANTPPLKPIYFG